jgi:hypothetical protein
MAALKSKLTAAEFGALDEAHRALYVPDGPGYKLDVESWDECHKRQLDQTRAELKEYKAARHARREASALTIPTSKRRLMAEVQERLDDGMSASEFEKAQADQKTEHETKLAELEASHQAKMAPLRTQLCEVHATGEVNAAMVRAGVADLHLLRPHVMQRVRAAMDGDDVVLRVIDADGNERVRPDGRPVTMDEMLREIQLLNRDLSMAFRDPIAWKMGGGNGGRNGNGAAH